MLKRKWLFSILIISRNKHSLQSNININKNHENLQKLLFQSFFWCFSVLRIVSALISAASFPSLMSLSIIRLIIPNSIASPVIQ